MARIQMPDDYLDQTPDGRVLATETVMNTVLTANLVSDRIERLLRPLGVSSAGGLVLGILRDHGPTSPSTISERLIVTRATMTGVLDSLERRGYVRRSPHATDRRSLIAEITPAGLAVLQELRTIVHRNEKAWTDALSDTDLRACIELLHRIQGGLTATDPPG
jgi:DNA-binding MarR family transcriptional regulator